MTLGILKCPVNISYDLLISMYNIGLRKGGVGVTYRVRSLELGNNQNV